MSIQKVSFEQLTRFLNRLNRMLRRDIKISREFHSEPAVMISSDKSGRSAAAVTDAPYQNRGVTTEGLERYYAKPGSAEYGC